ncbi:MAG: penicillin-binding transpeptidase domain-containing protein [Candidatus Metalachnospira sp.]|nr:penicillin-binding transpeptidase domain-containing protein [Candidatus Metalachnospira sp.]
MKKNKSKQNIRIRRQWLILFAMSAIMVVLMARIAYIKVVHGEEYEDAAKNQQTDDYDNVIVANRGSIVDRNNQAFAVSTRVYDLALDVRVLVQYDDAEIEKTLNGLAGLDFLSLDYSTIKAYTVKDENGNPAADTHWKVLAKKITREQKEQIEALGLKGVVFGADTKRSYPLGTVAADVVGFIRGDSSWGLESEYNTVLSGVNGREFKTYDGNSSAIVQTVEAQDGSTVVTTLDYTIQQYAEQAVAQAIKDYSPNHAAVLVMNPNTGEVYAMADSPTFDPNDPSNPKAVNTSEAFAQEWDAKSEEDQYSYLLDSWKNFNISYTFEPGSIFKPMVVAAALEEGAVTKNDTFYCSGQKTVYDRVINCWQKSGHGSETLQQVLSNSCNVAMMDIGQKLGTELFYKYQRDFGFGEKTGIDLPGEASASTLLYAEDAIGPVDLATMSFGQSFNCTAIQVLSAFSSVINGGDLMQPYIVSKIVNSNGDVTYEKKPTLIRKVISEDTSDTVRKYLQAVIDTGTGSKAKIEGYAIGGKTGTAQQAIRANEEYTVTFVGFLPVDNPQIIAIAIIDKPSVYTEGSASAAPMLKGLLENIIKYMGIQKTEAVTAASNAENSTVVLDDLTQYTTNEAISYLSLKGLNYQVVGEGSKVTSSAPHAGTEVQEGATVILYVTKAPGEDNTVQVPSVLGRNYDEAVAAIMNAGLSPVVEGDESGVVTSTSPQKGETVDKGSDIKLTFEVKNDGISEGSGGDETGAGDTGETTGTTGASGKTAAGGTSAGQKTVNTTRKSGNVVTNKK